MFHNGSMGIYDEITSFVLGDEIEKMGPDASEVHVPGNLKTIKAIPKKTLKLQKEKQKAIAKSLISMTAVRDVGPYDSDEDDLMWEGEIKKFDNDKKQVFGWCSLTTVNGEPVVDRQGDYIPLEEVEKSAYDYVVSSRKGGDMHRRVGEEPLHTSDMIESFVVTPEKLEKMGLPEDAMPHGWWVGFKVNDDEQWENVKKNQRGFFSIHGKGRRVEKMMP